MQRTDSIFFISGKQICGRLSLNLLSQAQVTRNEIGEILVYDFNTLADRLRETKQMQARIKKERLDNRSLNIYRCAVSLSSFTRFCFAGFFCTCSL